MASQTFKTYFYEGMPDSMTGTNWRKWALGFANHLDDIRDETKASLKAKYPTEAVAQSDTTALGLIGDDRQIERYFGETDAQYGARLRTAWDLYTKAGTETSITDDLEGRGFGDLTVREYIDWADLGGGEHESPGTNLDVNGDPWWSRFWLYIGEYGGADIPSGGLMGAAVMGTGVMGVALNTALISGVVRTLLQWKPAHALAVEIGWLLDGTTTASIMGIAIMGTSTLGPGAGTGVNYQTVMQ